MVGNELGFANLGLGLPILVWTCRSWLGFVDLGVVVCQSRPGFVDLSLGLLFATWWTGGCCWVLVVATWWSGGCHRKGETKKKRELRREEREKKS